MEHLEIDDNEDDTVSDLSSSPSIPDGDIDFDFVYALHTFQATVEGQATTQKGDTLELLDDTNSYWWLVKNTKDQGIGYLPAEHIETPTERLARLNKHRNVDHAEIQAYEQDVGVTKVANMLSLRRKKPGKLVSFGPSRLIEYEDDYTDNENELNETQIVDIISVTKENSRTKDGTIGSTSVPSTSPRSDLQVYSYSPQVLHGPKSAQLSRVNVTEPRIRTSPISASDTENPERTLHEPLQNDDSVRSPGDRAASREKKKKGVFGSLFKKKAKQEYTEYRLTDIEKTDSAKSFASSVPPQSEIASEVITVSTLNFPVSVKEISNSILMELDPIDAEMIEEPYSWGTIDEVERLHRTNTRPGTARPDTSNDARNSGSREVLQHPWSEAAFTIYLDNDQVLFHHACTRIKYWARTRDRFACDIDHHDFANFDRIEQQLDVLQKVSLSDEAKLRRVC